MRKTVSSQTSEVILKAILSTPGFKLKVKEIYEWIEANCPSFKRCLTWKNRISYTLSTQSMFKKLMDTHGSYWTVHADFIDKEMYPCLFKTLQTYNSFPKTEFNFIRDLDSYGFKESSPLPLPDSESMDCTENELVSASPINLDFDLQNLYLNHQNLYFNQSECPNESPFLPVFKVNEKRMKPVVFELDQNWFKNAAKWINDDVADYQ